MVWGAYTASYLTPCDQFGHPKYSMGLEYMPTLIPPTHPWPFLGSPVAVPLSRVNGHPNPNRVFRPSLDGPPPPPPSSEKRAIHPNHREQDMEKTRPKSSDPVTSEL